MRRWSILLAALAISAAPAPPSQPLILAFGDSLTAGYALDRGLGFAPQLQASLRRHGISATVIDGGVSGDTSQAGRARLAWTLDGLPRKPDLVIVELGGNDMLRALDPQLTRNNLDFILAELRRRKVKVVLAGMRAAPNLAPAYIANFDAMYPGLAAKYKVTLYPFFLENAVGRAGMMQSDGIHPTFAGVKAIVTSILPTVKRTLAKP